MKEAVYRKLARRLDRLPNGYPAAESGVEIKLLANIFQLEEAELAAEMNLHYETAEQIAERVNLPAGQVRQRLNGMVRKGLIRASRGDTKLEYCIKPFVVGFYEAQLSRIDPEMAELFEQYFQETQGKITKDKPSVHRVIPIEETIPLEVEVFPFERASALIGQAKSWGVRDCICRVQQQLIGKGCDHPMNNCLVFAPVEGAFDHSEEERPLTKQEALQILQEAARAGLVHTVGNYQGPHHYICNCCTCSCGVLRGLAEFGHQAAVASSAFQVLVDEQLCLGCGDCLDSCQFSALESGEYYCEVYDLRCVGCGGCVASCPEGALSLIRRAGDGEVLLPPEDVNDWGQQRQQERGNMPAG